MPRSARLILLSIAACAGALAAAGAARAATSDVAVERTTAGQTRLSGDLLVIDDRSIFTPSNTYRVELANGVLTVLDQTRGARVRPGNGCATFGGSRNEVRCPAAGVDGVVIKAGAGDDFVRVFTSLPAVIDGDSGDDTLEGPTGRGEINGAGGDDTIFGGRGDDTLSGGDGNDDLDGDDGNDRLDGGADSDRLRGAAGADTASYAERTGALTLTIGAGRDDGNGLDGPAGARDTIGDSIERVIGGRANDRIVGSIADEHINGGPGADAIDGGPGADTLDGDSGADLLDGGDGPDLLIGGGDPDVLSGAAGTDTASYLTSTTSVGVSLDGNPNDGTGDDAFADNVLADVENVRGGRAGDFIAGDAGPNRLDGGPGPDLLAGGGGDDQLVGGDDEDLLLGEAGRDNLLGERGNDRLEAADGEPDQVSCGTGGESSVSSGVAPNPSAPRPGAPSPSAPRPGAPGSGAVVVPAPAVGDSAGLDLTDIALPDIGDPLAAEGAPPADCENVQLAAVDEHPTVAIHGTRLRVTPAGAARLRLACPATVPAGRCAGRLRLHTRTRRRTRVIAHANYDLAAGQASRLTLELRTPRAIGRRLRVRASATERDRRGRTKLALHTLRLWPAAR